MNERLVATISVTDLPEVLAALRSEMAGALREAALDEPAAVAVRLRAIAAEFEVGQTEGDSGQ